MFDGAQVANQAIQGVLQRIDALATKIGTTAAGLWSIYVAQGRVEAIRDTAVAVVALLTALLCAFGVKSFWGIAEKEDQDEGGFWVFWRVTCCLVCVIGTIVYGYSAIGEFLNPQYWAFQHLTADLKNIF